MELRLKALQPLWMLTVNALRNREAGRMLLLRHGYSRAAGWG